MIQSAYSFVTIRTLTSMIEAIELYADKIAPTLRFLCV